MHHFQVGPLKLPLRNSFALPLIFPPPNSSDPGPGSEQKSCAKTKAQARGEVARRRVGTTRESNYYNYAIIRAGRICCSVVGVYNMRVGIVCTHALNEIAFYCFVIGGDRGRLRIIISLDCDLSLSSVM
jgi:hypothetical protein